jgi:D-serine deaminase-like pyridoxal phosphate-dependent protein
VTGARREAWERFRRVLDGRRLPALVVDLDAFDRNLARHLDVLRGTGVALRPATKSVRVPALLGRLAERGEGVVRGLMAYAVEEAAHLASLGLDDLLVAYPPWQRADLETAARLAAAGKTVAIAVDSAAAVDRLDEVARAHGTRVPVALCVDMSLRLAGGRVHVGVRRSPLHAPAEVLALARHVASRRGVVLDGLLMYEAQVAGLGDDDPGAPVGNAVKAWLRRTSAAEVRSRRRAIVEALRDADLPLRFVNGGGTGSLDRTSAERGVVTEVTAGSGFFKPHLFDRFRDRHVRALEPACFFALEVTRVPGPSFVTCLGGGYVASGTPGEDKVPLPWLPGGLALLAHEAAGEVQTPLAVPGGVTVSPGDPVLFRHAKAGEVAERFAEALLVSGERVVDVAPTYRGQGRCFF